MCILKNVFEYFCATNILIKHWFGNLYKKGIILRYSWLTKKNRHYSTWITNYYQHKDHINIEHSKVQGKRRSLCKRMKYDPSPTDLAKTSSMICNADCNSLSVATYRRLTLHTIIFLKQYLCIGKANNINLLYSWIASLFGKNCNSI